MSNSRKWRAKRRTKTPNARQKRNGLYLDAHPTCMACRCQPSREAHHELRIGDPRRYDWKFMKALCIACHVEAHQRVVITVVISSEA
jgi:hypothetical protein